METHQNNNQLQEPTYQAVDENFLRKEITKLLHSLGMPAHVLGYEYAREAIFIALGNKDILRSITKGLYPAVAQAFNTTPSRVERAIRHAVELAWDRGDLGTLQRFFGYTVSNTKGKPTNSEFLSALADHLRLELQLC